MLTTLWVWIILGFVLAYLIGSLSSAIIISRLFHLPDPRESGSKNPGATNVLRLSGKKMALCVFLGDLLKGYLTVFLAGYFLPTIYLPWIGLSVVLGHIFPIFFRFQGGKGVATSAGVMLALSWPLGISVMLLWLLIAMIFRYSSLAAIICAIVAPLYSFIWTPPGTTVALLLICGIILVKHYDNIKKLIKGSETKIGQTSK